MIARGGELVATDEPTVVAKPLLDAIVVEDGQSDGRLSNSTSTDESGWSEVFCQPNNLLDQMVASKAGPWRWGWGFSGYAGCKREMAEAIVVKVPDLGCV
jgi:hypothetical protein